MTAEITQPIAALAVWTMVIWVWMYVTRLPAMGKAGIDTRNMVGGTGADLEPLLPARAQWVAHNYNHLHEAPTLFYAVALALAFVGEGNGLNATIAWGYVGMRVAHSLFQILINRVPIRFVLFVLSSLALMALVANLALAVF